MFDVEIWLKNDLGCFGCTEDIESSQQNIGDDISYEDIARMSLSDLNSFYAHFKDESMIIEDAYNQRLFVLNAEEKAKDRAKKAADFVFYTRYGYFPK